MGSPGTTPLGASRADLAWNRAVGCAGDSHQHARAGEASPVDNSLLYRDVDLAALGGGDSFDRSDGAPVSAAEVADGARVGRARRFDRWHDSSHVGMDGAAGCYVESHAAGFRGGAVRPERVAFGMLPAALFALRYSWEESRVVCLVAGSQEENNAKQIAAKN
jgi:hypothetical protein